jgi:CheY-like chemotaxis protein
MRGTKPVLLLEDDHVDVLSISRAFKELKVMNPLQVVGNGEEGLQYLYDENKPKPCLILLDLNMPKMNGLEFLKAIKNDEELKRIPVIVLTNSKGDEDVVESYRHGVAGYIVKPANYLQFIEVVRAIDLYWTISEVPCDRG